MTQKVTPKSGKVSSMTNRTKNTKSSLSIFDMNQGASTKLPYYLQRDKALLGNKK